MERDRVIALLEQGFGCWETIDTIEIITDSEIEVNGGYYKILTDDEADREFEEYQINLFEDMGLECLSKWALEHVLENCVDKEWFEDAMKESYESYIDDIRNEDNRLAEEIKEADCSDEDEYLEYLCDDQDAIEWYRGNFGDTDFKTIVINENLVDMDAVIEYIKEQDGRGCIASYDGDEIELGNDLYAYRID